MTRCPICRRRAAEPCRELRCEEIRREIAADKALDLQIEASES